MFFPSIKCTRLTSIVDISKWCLLTTNILVKLMLLFKIYCMRTNTHTLYMECWKEPQGDFDVTSLHDLVNKVEIITQKKVCTTPFPSKGVG